MFAELDDQLDDIFGAGPVPKEDLVRPISNHLTGNHPAEGYVESCTECRGTGWWRPGYRCFKCGGKGKRTYKTSAKERASVRASDQRAKARKAVAAAEAAQAWKELNPQEWRWIESRPTFDFANSMRTALHKYGVLTENQLGAVRRMMLQDEERELERQARAQAAIVNAVEVTVEPIVIAFNKARDNGVRSPKLRLAQFRFDRAPDHGRNPGAIYVLDMDDNQRYLGKIVNGKFMRSRDCTDDLERGIVAVCADPHQAAIAYGRRYGACSVCGRELTNHASIDAGIGPICASKYGWA